LFRKHARNLLQLRTIDTKGNAFMNLSFENKVALVTGAGSGLGLATAKAFAEARAAVSGLCRALPENGSDQYWRESGFFTLAMV